MERCFLIAVTFVLLSATASLAEDAGKDKLKEWPYGPYDKLHRDADGKYKTSPPIIIRSEIHGTTTNGSRKIIIYRGTQCETVETPGTNTIAPPKLELHTR